MSLLLNNAVILYTFCCFRISNINCKIHDHPLRLLRAQTEIKVFYTQDKKRAMYKELKGQILSWPSRGLTDPYLKALLSNGSFKG